MAFAGELDDLPLQDILFSLSNRGRSGHLVLRTDTDEITLALDHGRVASVTTTDSNLRIGRLLVERGFVTEEQMEAVLALQAIENSTSRIGDLLVNVGYVTREQVTQAVAAQFEASLFRVLIHPNGTFTFERADSREFPSELEEIQIEPLMLNAIRLADEWLAKYPSNHPVNLVDRSIDAALLDRLADRDRSVIIAVLNGANTVHALSLSTTLSPAELYQAINRLVGHGVVVMGPAEAVTA